jgi:hypothetical protein
MTPLIFTDNGPNVWPSISRGEENLFSSVAWQKIPSMALGGTPLYAYINDFKCGLAISRIANSRD